MEECVIIGGGVAGLSAANRLIESGMSPLIIESGEYPSHRICGEYFSHECLPILNEWEIELSHRNDRVTLVQGNRKVQFQCPQPSGSCSRYTFDKQLLDRALAKGARAICQTKVDALRPMNGLYEIQLSNGQSLKSRSLIIGTGKLGNRKPKYFGYKAHFKKEKQHDALEMHFVPGGYFGISTIDEETVNVAAIMSEKINPDTLFQGSIIFPKWLEGQVPEFGIRENPGWDHVYWVGDAAGSIPPISGQGLTIGITSGCMAADYLLKGHYQEFKNDWLKRYKKRFFWAQMLHRMLMQPSLSRGALSLITLFPGLPLTFWKMTRGQ